MTAFRTRRCEAGDEFEINEVFNRITGNLRRGEPQTMEQMRWLWHQAPGGPADSWVIETQDSAGWKIVGHHGLCPVRFTLGDQDWLCAKTMKSFLLPEFRDKFLYLRFEQECLREADRRFDAIYSVQSGSTRLRSAFGYVNYGAWIQLERGLHPLHLIYRTMDYLAGQYSYPARIRLAHALASISTVALRETSLELTENTAADVASSSFFGDFWTDARAEAGMAPRRDSADLAWRFWKRPGFMGSTLTCAWPEGDRAYCIVDTSNPLLYSLVDFFITPVSSQRFENLLDALFIWCARQGALAVRCLTMTQGLPAQLREVFLRTMKPCALQRFFPLKELPRRLSATGKARAHGALADWNVTQFLMLA